MGVQAHYVSYLDGAISADPADEFTQGADGFGWRSLASPVLRGTGPVGYYDVAVKRFLLVPRAQVSPDGRRYTYMDHTQGGLYAFGQIHVVDAGSGRDRTLNLPAAQYEIFDFSADGIYFIYGPYAQSAGLWLLNPDTSVARHYPTSPLPVGEANPTPVVLNILLRRDVKSGQVQEWLRRPVTATHFELLGVYNGAPAVLIYSADDSDPRWTTQTVPFEVWLMSQPASTEKVDSGVESDVPTDPWYRSGREGLGIGDSRGIWLGGNAVYLYQHDTGLTKVADFPGFPANGCL